MAVSINKTCHRVCKWATLVVLIILRICLLFVMSKLSVLTLELTAEIRLLLCNLSKFWQMINLKFSFNPASISSLLIAFVLSVMIPGCYTVRVYHDTEMLREKHDGEISSVSMLYTDSQIGGPAKISSACPGGASLIEIEQTVSDGLVHYLSLGFYSPQTIRV